MAELVGLKFPFEVNSKGGLSLSRQTKDNSDIIDDKIDQLLNTSRGERTMECDIFSELDTAVFSPNDATTRTIVEYQVKQSLFKNIPEITVQSVSVVSQNKALIVFVTYKDNLYGDTHTTQVKVGDMG